MITSKPFSTISYNSSEFLEIALSDFVRSRKIYFFCFIEHQPEKDESKAHKHLFIYPNGKVDTDQVLSKLVEIDPTNPDKPLRCLMPRPSKFDDFYLYSCHNKAYLLSKGQARTYEYNLTQFVSSDNDTFLQLISEIDLSRITKIHLLEQAIKDGRSFSDIVFSGLVPIQQINPYLTAFQLGLERNGRTTHTPNVDNDQTEEEWLRILARFDTFSKSMISPKITQVRSKVLRNSHFNVLNENKPSAPWLAFYNLTTYSRIKANG